MDRGILDLLLGAPVMSPRPNQKEAERQLAFGFWQRTIEAAASPKTEPAPQETPREQELQSRHLRL